MPIVVRHAAKRAIASETARRGGWLIRGATSCRYAQCLHMHVRRLVMTAAQIGPRRVCMRQCRPMGNKKAYEHATGNESPDHDCSAEPWNTSDILPISA